MGVASADVHWSEWHSLVCREPSEFPLAPCTLATKIVVLPDDDPQHPLALRLTRAASAAVYAPLVDEGGAAIATLHVVRRRPPDPFDEHDRRLARSIADRTSLLLIATRGVTPRIVE
jgi:hypothetical protein